MVRSFYDLINQKRFDEAAAQWSPRMQANYPPSTNIYGRFDRTRQIVIRDISAVPQNTGGATVAIDILEVLDSGVTRRWVGTVADGVEWLALADGRAKPARGLRRRLRLVAPSNGVRDVRRLDVGKSRSLPRSGALCLTPL